MPLHVLCTFFVLYIIKGSAYGSYTAYGSYSLRTVFASIVCGPWSSGVFEVRLSNPLDCSFSGRTLLRVWIDLCDYWTVSFSGRTLLRVWIDLCDYWTVSFSGENFASYLDRFVRLLTTIWFSGENFASYYLDRFVIIIDNYFVLRENIASWFALNFV